MICSSLFLKKLRKFKGYGSTIDKKLTFFRRGVVIVDILENFPKKRGADIVDIFGNFGKFQIFENFEKNQNQGASVVKHAVATMQFSLDRIVIFFDTVAILAQGKRRANAQEDQADFLLPMCTGSSSTPVFLRFAFDVAETRLWIVEDIKIKSGGYPLNVMLNWFQV